MSWAPWDRKGQDNRSGNAITWQYVLLTKDGPEMHSSFGHPRKILHREEACSFQMHFIKNDDHHNNQTDLDRTAGNRAQVTIAPQAPHPLIGVSQTHRRFPESSVLPLNEFHMYVLLKKTGKLINNSIYSLLPTDHILFVFHLLY